MNNPYINYLLNETLENKEEILRCTKYISNMCFEQYPLSAILECSEKTLGYAIDKNVIVMFFDYLSKDVNPNILRNFIALDNLDIFCLNNQGNVVIKTDVLADMQLHYKTTHQEYVISMQPKGDLPENTNNPITEPDHISLTHIIIATIIAFIVIRVMAYYFTDNKTTETAESKDPLTDLSDTVTSTANDNILNSIDETLYLFKYYFYIPFFTALIYTIYYFYYKIKK